MNYNLNKFSRILNKFNVTELCEFIGRDIAILLEKIDPELIQKSSLIDNFNKTEDLYELLKNKKSRNIFLKKLELEEIKELSEKLSYPDTPSPDKLYSFLLSKEIQRTKNKFDELLIFFEVDSKAEEVKDSDNNAILQVQPIFKLRNYQIDIYNRTKRYLNSNQNRVLMHMPTGSGKTVTAMNLIAEFLRNETDKPIIIWLAHNTELCNQAVSSFKDTWTNIGNKEIAIQRHYGDYKEYNLINNGIFITSLSQLYNDLTRSNNQRDLFVNELAKKTLLVVFDEGHKAIADTYQLLVNYITNVNNCGFLGLTATPGRSYLDEGEDVKLANFYLKQKVNIQVPHNYDNPIEFLQSEGFLSKVSIEPMDYTASYEGLTFDANDNLDLPDDFLKKVSEDEARNLLVIKRTRSEFALGGKILLFASSVKNAKVLNAILIRLKLPSDVVSSETSKEKRKYIIDKFSSDDYRGILVNYDILTTGFDVPSANVAIIARPVRSLVLYSQMCGRVIRGKAVKGGTENAKIIQIIDKTYGFRDLGEGFSFWDDLWYNDEGK
jgi:DNA repair protein RadD